MATKYVWSLVVILFIATHYSANILRKKDVLENVLHKLQDEIEQLSKIRLQLDDETKVETENEADIKAKVETEEESIVEDEVKKVLQPPKDKSDEVDINVIDQEVGEDVMKAEVEKQLPSETNDVVVHGDAVLTLIQEQVNEYLNNKNITHDMTIQFRNKWPSDTDGLVRIPYEFDKKIVGSKATVINNAIQRFAQETCIRWVPRTGNEHFVKFISDTGCYSYIGRNLFQAGFQPISIGNGCESLGTAEHEMLHALGFYHEQSRRDRDKYVTVNLDNLVSQNLASNFRKEEVVPSQNQPYDLQSIMHYSSTAFTKDHITPLYTITLKNGQPYQANRRDFSVIDLAKINAFYCTPTTVAPVVTTTKSPPLVGLDTKTCLALKDLVMCRFDSICDNCPACKNGDKTTVLPNVAGDANCYAWAGRGYCSSQDNKYFNYVSKNCFGACFAKKHPSSKARCT